MSTIRVCTVNALATATLKNGTGGGAPARDETAPNVMENAANADLHSVWASSATPASPRNVDFDLGATKTVGLVGVSNLIAAPAALSTIALAVQTGAYTPGGTWTTVASLNTLTSPRSTFAVFADASARSVRLTFTGTGPTVIGRLWVGAVADLGEYPSPDYVEQPERMRETVFGPVGQMFGADYGVTRTTQRMTLRDTDPVTVATMRTLADRAESFVYVSHRDVGWEVFILPGDLTLREKFHEVYDVDAVLTHVI